MLVWACSPRRNLRHRPLFVCCSLFALPLLAFLLSPPPAWGHVCCWCRRRASASRPRVRTVPALLPPPWHVLLCCCCLLTAATPALRQGRTRAGAGLLPLLLPAARHCCCPPAGALQGPHHCCCLACLSLKQVSATELATHRDPSPRGPAGGEVDPQTDYVLSPQQDYMVNMSRHAPVKLVTSCV